MLAGARPLGSLRRAATSPTARDARPEAPAGGMGAAGDTALACRAEERPPP